MKKETKVAASLKINSPNEMTTRGKKQIAAWLIQQARQLIEDGELYANNYTARYYYENELRPLKGAERRP